MLFGKYNHVVETFATDTADYSFRITVCYWNRELQIFNFIQPEIRIGISLLQTVLIPCDETA